MRPAPRAPSAQVYVCTNARAPEDPLRSACGEHGPGVFRALKAEVFRRSGGRVWVTATGCQGHCPRGGCAVALQPSNTHLVDVTEGDVPALTEVLCKGP
ncbi:MAG: (2Fe-2S) ferredoxin domain-containing protein [Deltaproteobacteria bacterium]|nr:(2Fe-2S) ferredoxin domain-containing protein [Deltaproteobacteria bacterium]